MGISTISNSLSFSLGVPFILCLALTPSVRSMAQKNGWIAYPKKERWHTRPTAKSGGIAIFLGMAIPLAVTADFSSIFPTILEFSDSVRLPSLDAVMLIGITLFFILGLIDDFRCIKPHTKLAGQIMVASVVAFLGFRLRWFSSLTLDTMVTIVWIVGITNAFNLIDNMDGLCAGIGCIASLFMAVLFADVMPEAARVCLIIAGPLAAFLIYNFNPASIFMGDCGSLIIGFSLSMMGLSYAQSGSSNMLASYTVPVMVLMVPILDTTLVTVIRILSGRKASVGGKDHTSHRLVLVGFTQKGAVLFLYGVGFVSGVAALFVSRSDTLTSPAVIIPLTLAALLMGIYLAQLRVYPEKEFSLLRDRPYTPILIELTYKRQLVLVALDLWLIAFSYYLAYRLRFDSKEFPYYFKIFLHSLPAVIVCKFAAFFASGIYKGFWRYLSTSDVSTYLKGSLMATLLTVAAVTAIYRLEDLSKGIFLIDGLLTTGLLLGTRGSFRISLDSMYRKTLDGDTVFIYGAGCGGELLLREILHNKKLHIKPVGFIDDDPIKIGKTLQGYPIMGSFNEMESLLQQHPVNGLLISFNNKNGNGHKVEKVKEFCRDKGLFLKRFTISLDSVDTER